MSNTSSRQNMVDLSDTPGRQFIGRDLGKQMRIRLKLDDLDSQGQSVKVVVPENAVGITSSFFLGLFGQSVRSCGTKDQFLSKYQFEFDKLPPHLKASILAGISKAITSSYIEA